MRIVTKGHLPRRALLQGMGAAIGLPLLESMVPALTAQRLTAAAPVKRLGFVYVPHGAVMSRFTPATQGTGFEFTPILKPIERFRDRITVVSGLANRPADNAGVHSLGPPTWLSGVRPAEKDRDIRAGTTIDQMAAQAIGATTQFPSLELATEDHAGLIGACDGGYSCTYINTLSWRTPTTPLPMEINPRTVFERLFGEGGTPEQRAQRLRQDRSILDAVTAQASKLKMQVGASDRATVAQYLDNIREIERRIQLAEKQSLAQGAVPAAPVGIPDVFEDHIRLMFDLQVLAFQADLTRVTTFMMARELSQRTYPEANAFDPHHSVSHHQDDPGKIDTLTRIQTHHMKLFAYYLDKLRTTRDGAGSLLDHSMILYGSNMSNSNLHNHFPLPTVLVGGCAGQLAGGRHMKYADYTPMANLLQTMLAKLDVRVDRVGDSTGTLADL